MRRQDYRAALHPASHAGAVTGCAAGMPHALDWRAISHCPLHLKLLCFAHKKLKGRMLMQRRDFLALLGGAALLPHTVRAQNKAMPVFDYPNRPVTLIVPYAPGGGNDVLARGVAEPMSKTLGQQIVIENHGGAGGSLGTRQVAKAAPDGYTLGLGGTGTLAIDPTLYPNVGYDPRKDFAPVGLIATSPLIILVNPSLPAHNVQELIALAKAQPGKLNYASAGKGSGIHLGTVLFAEKAGIDITHIPYKGSGPALTDLLGNHVSLYFSSLPPAIGLVKEGKLRALGVTGLKRSPIFPDVPTVAEQGMPGFEAVLHYGIVAPAGTPRPIVDKLNAALRTALGSAEVHKRIATEGAEPLPTTPDEYAADIDREETKWSALVKKSGAQAK
jgi:tripartite-type tricarboxylate transporter receptor subunit TctC